jgi:hypothetical protein
MADMHIILWSVISDLWNWIFKIFLKICQRLEISLRSVIRDPQLIFVFWLRETFWQGWYAFNSVIRDPWSVIYEIEFFKFFSKFASV